MIVGTEAEPLRRGLASTADLVDEINVASTAGQAEVAAVAREFRAKVADFPWCDDFSAARNASRAMATGEWIFWLDADESLDALNRCKLQELFTSLPEANAAFVMKQRSPPAPGSPTATSVDHVRLFRNRPQHRWRYRVHEQILPALHATEVYVHWTPIVISHSGYEDSALRRRQLERNFGLLLLDHAQYPDEPFICFNLGWAYCDLGRPCGIRWRWSIATRAAGPRPKSNGVPRWPSSPALPQRRWPWRNYSWRKAAGTSCWES